jgi:hypothetical protein
MSSRLFRAGRAPHPEDQGHRQRASHACLQDQAEEPGGLLRLRESGPLSSPGALPLSGVPRGLKIHQIERLQALLPNELYGMIRSRPGSPF